MTPSQRSPDGPIGDTRAAKLEAYIIKEIGHKRPLHFANSWCRFNVESLAELTEAQGKTLISECRTQMFLARQQVLKEQQQGKWLGGKM